MDENKNIVIVQFPCIHGFAKGQLIPIKCFSADEPRGTITVIGIGHNDEYAKKVVDASRYSESDGRVGISVIAAFSNPNFSGESYGSALAVADKLARLNRIHHYDVICATGVIHADGCGTISKVNGFVKKLDLLIEKATPNSLFLYPKNNLSPKSDIIQEKLNLLKSKGVKCIAISEVNDLEGILWTSDSEIEGVKSGNKWPDIQIQFPLKSRPILLALAFIVLISLIAFYEIAIYRGNSPFEGSEKSIQDNTNFKVKHPVRTSSHNAGKNVTNLANDVTNDGNSQEDQRRNVLSDDGSIYDPIIESKNTDPSSY